MKVAKARKRNPVTPIQVPSDYEWKVLSAVVDDLHKTGSLDAQIEREMRTVLRSRDFSRYLNFCEQISLNRHKYQEIPVPALRCTRMLALAEKYVSTNANRSTLTDNAMEKFYQAEDHCAVINKRGFDVFEASAYNELHYPVFEHAKHFCAQVLGDLHTSDVLRLAKHGPGATLSTSKGQIGAFFKLQPPFSVSKSSMVFLKVAIMSNQLWFRSLLMEYLREPRVHRLNKVGTNNPVLKYFTGLPAKTRKGFWDWLIVIAENNRVVTVPKSAKLSALSGSNLPGMSFCS